MTPRPKQVARYLSTRTGRATIYAEGNEVVVTAGIRVVVVGFRFPLKWRGGRYSNVRDMLRDMKAEDPYMKWIICRVGKSQPLAEVTFEGSLDDLSWLLTTKALEE